MIMVMPTRIKYTIYFTITVNFKSSFYNEN